VDRKCFEEICGLVYACEDVINLIPSFDFDLECEYAFPNSFYIYVA
jgi:hypothetical protein